MNFSHITWLDDKGHIKPPLALYLMLAFLARGWCVFIASLTQMSDRSALVRLFYPQKTEFLWALGTGAGAVLLYFVVIAERKRSPAWIRPLFGRLAWPLWGLLLLDGAILLQRLLHSDLLFNWRFAFDAVLLFWCVLYLLKSRHLHHYLRDWPSQP
ncbi:DUF2919 domain-containing protein [Shewanella sp. AS16]|uniref:DUF2919 domain-containing protein n=1 Tax=Shewanella sp. AS16 TaxID=2907625 RepID=UPI001F473719|nr:DUF2919 domain-containing protein [Shewanella sp. AS16]MCE9686908.1 DUF2919 domain-containing protein [Shewanella sp. AS16]